MKKIGIITINGDNNYGNRLQNYALEQIIISLGYDATTVVFPQKLKLRDAVRELLRLRRREYRDKRKKFKKMNRLKTVEFQGFRTKYLHNKIFSIKDDFSSFDRFITGSDQVWNPSWRLIDEYWLRFVPQQKRFSYSASMATKTIHRANIKKLPIYLSEMNEISVREDESVDFIKEISGREATVVLDPTMLLRKKDYKTLISTQIESKVDSSSPFILVYALVGLPERLQNKLENFAENKGLKIVYIMGNEYHAEHMVYNPIEFVEAIDKATLVVSDSFHCGVFSIIMKTDFILFNRVDGADMGSRITSLVSRFDLESQLYIGGDIEEYMSIDFDKLTEKIDCSRDKSLEYLKFILEKPL